MAKSLNDRKLLIGAGEIMTYLNCNKDLLKTFLEKGMPATKICGRWYAHIDNINKFFEAVTARNIELIDRIQINDDDLNENGC